MSRLYKKFIRNYEPYLVFTDDDGKQKIRKLFRGFLWVYKSNRKREKVFTNYIVLNKTKIAINENDIYI